MCSAFWADGLCTPGHYPSPSLQALSYVSTVLSWRSLIPQGACVLSHDLWSPLAGVFFLAEAWRCQWVEAGRFLRKTVEGDVEGRRGRGKRAWLLTNVKVKGLSAVELLLHSSHCMTCVLYIFICLSCPSLGSGTSAPHSCPAAPVQAGSLGASV